ncbi:MAG: 6-phosphofructokinase [Oscillospiraceae bacterium]
MKRKTRVALLTSGGDCQGLNATIRAIGKTLFQYVDNLEIYGMYDGYRGLVEGDYRFMESGDFSGIINLGGTILGTSRLRYIPGKAIVDKDGNDLMPAMLATYNRLNLDCVVCLGGNGTQKSARLLMDAGMNVITLPKTIDNDIYGTDETFGFQSAVDIATHVMDSIHTTALAHSRIFLVECMGRDAGWLTLSAGLASGADVILIPEIPYDISKVADFIEERRRRGRAFTIIAVAEGAVSKNDDILSEEERRALKAQQQFPVVSYEIAAHLERLTGQEARVVVPGHFQRGGSPCPRDRVLATRFGAAAAHLIMEKRYGCMVGMVKGEIVTVPLEEAASRTKFLPADHPLIQVARDTGVCFGD